MTVGEASAPAVDPRRNAWLLALCGCRIFLYAPFMVVAAALPVLRTAWGVSAAQAGLITAAFTLTYAMSLVLFSWLADRLGARRVIVLSALATVAASIPFALAATDYLSTLVLYALVGLSLGGTYTPMIMLLGDETPPSARGRVIGWLIASTSLGYAFSLVVSGACLTLGGWRLAFVVAGVLPIVGTIALLGLLRGTANRIHPRPGGGGLKTVLRASADARRLILGYTAHSWELLGMWAWLPAFLAASVALAGADEAAAAGYGARLSAALHLVGAFAAGSMGWLSDRADRRVVLIALAAASAALSLAYGWLIAWPVWLLVALGLAYNFAALGDSPVLSTALSESVPPGHLGATLALRSILGFGAGALAVPAFGLVLDLTNPPGGTPATWGWAFMTLGAGGLIATVYACALQRRGRPVTTAAGTPAGSQRAPRR